MTKLLVFSALAAFGIAGCATEDTRIAKADCKIAPITTASVASDKAKSVDPIRQRMAEMDLSTSNYRVRQLSRNGMANNNVEDALRDCY